MKEITKGSVVRLKSDSVADVKRYFTVEFIKNESGLTKAHILRINPLDEKEMRFSINIECLDVIS